MPPLNHEVSAGMSQALLECQQLACERDGRYLFSGLDLKLNPGDIVHIEGPNGCCKTTLLRTITSLSSDYEGGIYWRGQSLNNVLADYRANLLFLGHLAGIKKSLSARENLLFLTRLYQCANLDAIDASLAQVGLYGFEDLPAYQLSAGQVRRIALARLFLSSAPLWILDEPYTAIDKQGIHCFEQRIKTHADSGGVIILSSHQALQIDGIMRVNLLDYNAHGQFESTGNTDNGS